MSRRVLAFLLLAGIWGCALWLISPQAVADISAGFKATLIDAANAISADAETFRELVRTEVSAEIIKAKGFGTEALALLSRRGTIQTSLVDTAITKAMGRINKAQSGIGAARSFKEYYLEAAVYDLGQTIDSKVSTKITQTEAAELGKILANCLGGCLESVNQTLVDISINLAQASSDFLGARTLVELASPTARELRKAKSLVSSAMRRLEAAWRGEVRVKESMKCLIYGLCRFKSAVLTAPLKTSGLALSPPAGATALSALRFQASGSGRGPIRFAALGAGLAGLRVEVFSPAGRAIFDSGWVSSSALEWLPRNDRGAPLANGVYLYTVAVKGYDGTVLRSEVRKLVILR
ncbi:MAG: hypothetical protein NUW06_08090 [Candidatus Acetothermia bacterium]|nr:hypothetical protein [Candidatus Acetothermia bacterium]MDH7505995.1 hypothetical protein [Candidatus Acetothermia bacterium]